MRDYITVKIPMDKVLDMFSERLDRWNRTNQNNNPEEHDLYMKMYERLIECGCFDDSEFDIDSIVDNDVINWTTIYYSDNDKFDIIKEFYKNDDYDVDGVGTIEVVDDEDNPTMFLIRD